VGVAKVFSLGAGGAGPSSSRLVPFASSGGLFLN
jgi:hypothetical protein